MLESILDPPVGAALLVGIALLVLSALAGRRAHLVVARPASVLIVVAAISLVAVFAMVRFDPPGLRLLLDPVTISVRP